MRYAAHSFGLILLATACGSSSGDKTSSTETGGTGGAGIGGQVSAGGKLGSGGQITTGGTASGGAARGGAASGGTASGGAARGGAASGGAASGGAASGGAASGGAASGGAASGGAASGGAASGGAASGGATVGGSSSVGGNADTGGSSSLGGTTDSGGSPAVGGDTGVGGLNEAGGAAAGGTSGVECGTVATPGEEITFNDDGGWCWYQDERVIVDPEANKLIIGSVAINGSRNGNIDVTMYDLAGGGTPTRSTLGDLNPDDHNTAGLSKVGPDKYVAVYTTHNDDCNSYYNVYENGSWGSQKSFSWSSHGCPTDNGKTVSYSNLWHMGDKIYNFVRSTETSPNLLTSDDGSTWTYSGRLTGTDRVGYVAGYYKYWGNNVDRIDFVGTEAHPRDFDNSLYHGYVKDGKVHSSDGTVVDDNLLDGNAQNVTAFTKVFATGAKLGEVTLTHLWNCDLMRYPDGTIVLIFTGRADGNTDDPDKRFGYARFDGTSWKTKYLVKAGHKLYDSEQDYTGLGAIHPTNPNTIYISTTTDPRDDTTAFNKHEIWRGTTCDGGETFEWTPITQDSTKDNLRPVVPYWESTKTALLWMRGDYKTAQTYDTDIVGVIMDGP